MSTAEQRSATGRRSRRRGRAFEQAIARDLRNWLGEDWAVTRNPTSFQRGKGGGTAGEFSILGPAAWPWTVECKADERFSYHHLWMHPLPGPLGSKTKSEGWIDQAIRQADCASRSPLLVIRCNNKPTLALMRRTNFVQLWAGLPRPSSYMHLEPVTREQPDVFTVLCWSDLMALPVVRLGEIT